MHFDKTLLQHLSYFVGYSLLQDNEVPNSHNTLEFEFMHKVVKVWQASFPHKQNESQMLVFTHLLNSNHDYNHNLHLLNA